MSMLGHPSLQISLVAAKLSSFPVSRSLETIMAAVPWSKTYSAKVQVAKTLIAVTNYRIYFRDKIVKLNFFEFIIVDNSNFFFIIELYAN